MTRQGGVLRKREVLQLCPGAGELSQGKAKVKGNWPKEAFPSCHPLAPSQGVLMTFPLGSLPPLLDMVSLVNLVNIQ